MSGGNLLFPFGHIDDVKLSNLAWKSNSSSSNSTQAIGLFLLPPVPPSEGWRNAWSVLLRSMALWQNKERLYPPPKPDRGAQSHMTKSSVYLVPRMSSSELKMVGWLGEAPARARPRPFCRITTLNVARMLNKPGSCCKTPGAEIKCENVTALPNIPSRDTGRFASSSCHCRFCWMQGFGV